MNDPVLVVGAGPTGLTAAFELRRLGLPVRIIDKRDAPATTSRAIGVQARTLELLHQRGLADELIRHGNRGEAGSVYGGGKRVFRLDFGRVDSRFDYMLFVSQAQTERVLRDALARFGVEPEWSVELVGVAQDAMAHAPSPVTATLRRADGALEQVRTPWLISAEGAHSVVRTTLDLQFEGKTRDEQYALGDLFINGDLADSDFHIFSSEHGFMGLFPMGGRRFRLIASHPFSAPSKDTAPSLEEIQRIYDQRSPVPARFHDMGWSSWFRINSRMVQRLKVGRLFLGGDSAHIHSPAGAQGMNTGIQDMINLAWKLVLVTQGRAAEALLDTYEQDRLPVMHDVLFKTENLTDVIGSENHLVRSLFNIAGPWIGGAAPVQAQSTARMAQVALGYRDSPISAEHAHTGALKAGDRVPDLSASVKTDGGWRPQDLLDVLDPSRFVLLVAHDDEDAMVEPSLRDVAAGAGDLISIVELAPAHADEEHRHRHAFGGRSNIYLVRPDGYVALAAAADGADKALGSFIDRWIKTSS
jgi:2-polyprenyl-6-methoxyphenol hydroxylase-like FAD-dependent oxidoreductase